jgi:hypothetical protein
MSQIPDAAVHNVGVDEQPGRRAREREKDESR